MKKILKSIPGTVFLKNRLIAKASEIWNEQNVVMLHTGRCGSTVLSTMLEKRSDVFWAGEIFEPFMNSQKKVENLHKVVSANREKKISRVFGFEIKHLKQLHLSSNCIDLDLTVLIDELKKIKNIKFILLERENYLRRAISAQVAREKKVWHTKSVQSDIRKINIDVNSFQTGRVKQPLLELFTSMDNNCKLLKEILPDSSLFISYEKDVLKNPKHAYKKICKYLDLVDKDVEVELKKTNPFQLKELIVNYNEVSELLKGTQYEWMLKE